MNFLLASTRALRASRVPLAIMSQTLATQRTGQHEQPEIISAKHELPP
jgi:hypothetical protein